jgi:putative copper export protein
MSELMIALIVLAFVFGGAVLGLWLQSVLSEQHLSNDTKDVVRLSTALIATVSAMVLSLLVSSAKSAFDRYDDELTQNAARVVMLDRALEEFGPQTSDIRAALKSHYASRIEALFPAGAAQGSAANGALAVTREETIDARLLALTPVGPVQEGLLARAVSLNYDINMTSTLIDAQREDSIPTALLIVLAIWMALIFATFGLFAPRNRVVVAALATCALSAAGAVLLILEMNSPFTGLITLSSAPMHEALGYLGK